MARNPPGRGARRCLGPSHLLAATTSLSRPEAALRQIVTDLGTLGRRFALVGGLAVSVRTEPRLTRDADLAVLVADDRDAEALAAALNEAREALALVAQRRFHHSRDLLAALDAAVNEFRAEDGREQLRPFPVKDPLDVCVNVGPVPVDRLVLAALRDDEEAAECLVFPA